jgi:hypothetical protein
MIYQNVCILYTFLDALWGVKPFWFWFSLVQVPLYLWTYVIFHMYVLDPLTEFDETWYMTLVLCEYYIM